MSSKGDTIKEFQQCITKAVHNQGRRRLGRNQSTYHNDTITDRIASLKQPLLGARAGLKAVLVCLALMQES
jgi:hypothetical protein